MTQPAPFKMLVGMDVGQANDPTTLAAIRMTGKRDEKGRMRPHFGVVALKRWELRTPYPQIVRDVVQLFARPVYSGERKPLHRATLVIDRTGVGRPVFDAFRDAKIEAAAIAGLTITAGAKDGHETIAKQNLVSALVMAFGEGRLEIAAALPLAGELVRELEVFKAKTTTAKNIAYGAEAGSHDDLVCAVGLPVAYGARLPIPGAAATPPSTYSPRGLATGHDLRGEAALHTVNSLLRAAMGGRP